jgi:hypothetical protein
MDQMVVLAQAVAVVMVTEGLAAAAVVVLAPLVGEGLEAEVAAVLLREQAVQAQ